MGDGTKKSPYTREDVLRLIKENGGKAEGLDLSERTFEEGIDLSDLDLSGIKLNNARLFLAKFNGSNLDRAVMLGTKLQHATFNPLDSKDAELKNASLQSASLGDADLTNAEFRHANLTAACFWIATGHGMITWGPTVVLSPAFLHGTDFRGANLFLANFKDCYFYGTKLDGAYIRGADIYDAHLEEADWGSYIIGEENKKEELYFALNVYRKLKIWYTNAGMYDVAGEFFFREMEAKRKAQSWKKEPHLKIWSWVMRLLCGYGEKPERVVISAIVVVFGLAAAYYFWGSFSSSSFLDTLYYSVASFTALGYGNWAPQPTGWAKGMGAAEAVGVFMMALFLVTFIRKMTR